MVVCANGILMGVEADLGLLGPAGPTWTGGGSICHPIPNQPPVFDIYIYINLVNNGRMLHINW